MQNSPLYDELLKKLSDSLSILPDKPEETPVSCLMALWHKAAGLELSAGSAIHEPLRPLSQEAEVRLRKLVDERLSGRPLAYLTDRQQVMGIDVLSRPQ